MYLTGYWKTHSLPHTTSLPHPSPKCGPLRFPLSLLSLERMALRSSVGMLVLNSITYTEMRSTSMFQNAFSILDPLPSPDVRVWRMVTPQKNEFDQEVICSRQNTMHSASPRAGLPGTQVCSRHCTGFRSSKSRWLFQRSDPRDLNLLPLPCLWGAH